MTEAKIYAAIAVVGFVLGAGITHFYYKNEINEIFKAQEAAVKAQEEKNYEILRGQTQKLAEAFVERDKAMERVNGLLLDIERLRNSVRSGGMPEADGNSAKSDSGKLARCRGLLAEGADLLIEGGRICGRIAADKDTLSGLVEPKN